MEQEEKQTDNSNQEEPSESSDTKEAVEGDQHLICQQCNSDFLFSEREQKFFLEMGFVPPRYCPECRKARKRDNNKNSSDWKEFYEVDCHKCGDKTTVPFKPVNGRPVYCKSCLSDIRSENGEYHDNGRPIQNGSQAPETLNDVLGIGISMMEDAERPYMELDTSVTAILSGFGIGQSLADEPVVKD